MDTLDGECTHVIQTRQEYEMLLNQRDRAQREKEEAERAATREITRVNRRRHTRPTEPHRWRKRR